MDKLVRAKALRIGESRLHVSQIDHLRQGRRECESQTQPVYTAANSVSDPRATWALLDMAAGLMRVSDADIGAAIDTSATFARMLRIGARHFRGEHIDQIHARLPRLWTGMLFLACVRDQLPDVWAALERALDGQSAQEAA